MKKLSLIICLSLLAGIFSPAFLMAQKSSEFAFKQNERLGRGVNIIGYDPIWQDPANGRMKEKHFKFIKEAGFDNVRLVIMPFKFSTDDQFTIDPLFFKTLDWAINESLKNDLMVIVDFHEHNAMQQDPLGKKPMFLSMWRQIAEHCKDYPDEVLFEVANEPNMNPDIWNEMHEEARQILRKSNPDRTILIGPIYGNQIKYLRDLVIPQEDENIIVPIHYYMPIQFTHQGAPWSTRNKDLSGIEWNYTAQEIKDIKFDFDMAQLWSERNNRPLTLGEFGVYEKADMPSRIRWTDYIARQAEARNWSWSYWQFDRDFILYDLDKDTWVTPIKNALLDHNVKTNTVSGTRIMDWEGVILSHEHVMSNFGAKLGDRDTYDEAALFAQVIPYLRNLKSLGVSAIYDCTTEFFGRRPDLLKYISDSTGIQIITNTGYYGAADDRFIPQSVRAATVEKISKEWIDEFTHGIGHTGIKPGFIKLGFDAGSPSDLDIKLFKAGVLAHRETGLSLAVHIGENKEAVKAQLQMLQVYQVSPEAWVWVHANKYADDDFLMEVARQGGWISLDGVNENNIDEYLKRLEKFKSAKLLHKVLLSHDGNGFPAGGAIRPFEAIPRAMVPAMKEKGFTAGEINQLMVENPKKAFEIKVRKND